MEFVDMIRPGSGCRLAEEMEFSVFQYVYIGSLGNPCKGCAYIQKCKLLAKQARDAFSRKQKNFGKANFETNAEIAKRLNISKRQVAKMRKRGEV